MRKFLFIVIVFLTNHLLSQQAPTPRKYHYGISANITMYSANYGLARTFSASVWRNKHQFELGCLYGMFWSSYDTKNIGTEFNYQYYPNGIGKRFDVFLLANSFCFYHREAYTNNNGYYTEKSKTTSSLYGANFGYGFNLKIAAGLYLSPKVGIGAILEDYTYDRSVSSSPDEDFYQDYTSVKFNFFSELTLGYRF